MKEKISRTLEKVQNDTPRVPSPSTSTEIKPKVETLGNPDCPYCQGVGYVRYDLPLGHEKFGKIELCVCRSVDRAEKARNRLYSLSSLDRLSHLDFENFSTAGHVKSKYVITQVERDSLEKAKETCRQFSLSLKGWILLEGSYGSGKTHLAAAIANAAVSRGVPTLFITVPDLLDSLRFAYNSPETTFEQRLDDIRNADLLVMDDFGTHNATSWAQEKLFQVINYRHTNQLPTVITTNMVLDEIESRIRSRLQDEELVQHIRIFTFDYRHPEESNNPGLSMLAMHDIKEMTFKTWQDRGNEIGQEIVTVKITERKGAGGYTVKDKEIEREKMTREHLDNLEKAHAAAVDFAENPQGWLVLLSPSFCGKTHLAAAVGNYRMGNGGQVAMADVSALLDYLKGTFRPNTDVSFDRRFYEIRTTPLLILDDFKESNMNTAWSEDKLYQVLNYRFYENLPTVITSSLDPHRFSLSHPSLWYKLAGSEKCQVHTIDMPPYLKPKVKGKKK